jgi:hypothetical protein
MYLFLFFIDRYVFFVFLCHLMGRQNLSKPISLRVSPSVREMIKKISDDTGLLQAQVFDTILQAGCRALEEIADEDVTFPLPLRFSLKKKAR